MADDKVTETLLLDERNEEGEAPFPELNGLLDTFANEMQHILSDRATKLTERLNKMLDARGLPGEIVIYAGIDVSSSYEIEKSDAGTDSVH